MMAFSNSTEQLLEKWLPIVGTWLLGLVVYFYTMIAVTAPDCRHSTSLNWILEERRNHNQPSTWTDSL